MKNRSLYISTKQNRHKDSLTDVDQEFLERFRPHFEQRLKEFKETPRRSWVREVSFCILTPQSTPFNAEQALLSLEAAGLFEGKITENVIQKILGTSHHYVRFHKTKAKRLLSFLASIPRLEELFSEGMAPKQERGALSTLLQGYGLKEASHALRNIGRRGLTILDRHIMRTLEGYGVIEKIPTSFGPSRYLEIEERFLRWADTLQEDVDVLDFLFWGKATGIIFK